MVAYTFKRRFVERIRSGLSSVRLSWDPEPKLQTIRAIGKRRHARPGEALQLYHGMRSRDCFKIGDAKCTRVREIRISFCNVAEGRIVVGDNPAIVSQAGLDDFAKRDGFDDWPDMQQFWREEHGDLKRLGPFVGILVEWAPQ